MPLANESDLDARYTTIAHAHDAADITTGIVDAARLGSGTPGVGNFLRGDGAWTAIAGGGDMLKSENLSGLANYVTARTNLGLGTAAITDATAYATAAQGAKADTALQSIPDGTTAATSATTGTMTVNMTTDIVTITPTGACTFNASGGTTGRILTFSITTSGTSSFTLTFGTNFRKVGTLATGTVSARFFAVTFRCLNGTTWQEIARTAAQT